MADAPWKVIEVPFKGRQFWVALLVCVGFVAPAEAESAQAEALAVKLEVMLHLEWAELCLSDKDSLYTPSTCSSNVMKIVCAVFGLLVVIRSRFDASEQWAWEFYTEYESLHRKGLHKRHVLACLPKALAVCLQVEGFHYAALLSTNSEALSSIRSRFRKAWDALSMKYPHAGKRPGALIFNHRDALIRKGILNQLDMCLKMRSDAG
jgi:hypothetical protein